jgi:hypothetical protein
MYLSITKKEQVQNYTKLKIGAKQILILLYLQINVDQRSIVRNQGFKIFFNSELFYLQEVVFSYQCGRCTYLLICYSASM